jgi:hypothetical protein
MSAIDPPPAGERDDLALRAYLAILAGAAPKDHFLELRFRVGPHQLVNHFFPAQEPDALIASIWQRCPRTDVYVGCAPRTRRSGTKDAISQVWTLWAECDGEESVRQLRRFRPQPALVIASGSGPNCHAYWPLVAPLCPRRAEAASLRLVHAIGSDPNCFDASRILRPPGTWNHKHTPPTPVAVLRLHPELRFTREEVVDHLPTVGQDVLRRRWDAPAREHRDDPLLTVEPRVYVADLLGVAPGRDRKVACPFHEDRRASLHVYPTGRQGWCCFSCRRGGTISDLAAGVWGMGTRGPDFVRVRDQLLERYGRELGGPLQELAR